MVRNMITFQYILIPKESEVIITSKGFSIKSNRRKNDLKKLIYTIKSREVFSEDIANEEINKFSKESAYIFKKDSSIIRILINNGNINISKNSIDLISIKPELSNFNTAVLKNILELIKRLIVEFNLKIFDVDKLKITSLNQLENRFNKINKQNET